MEKVEQLPSGKKIITTFDDVGQITQQLQIYGMGDIAIQYEYTSGQKSDELYFVKRRLVSRKSYDKVRAEYTDMPPADASLEDVSGELIKGARAEQRARAKTAKAHVPDPGAAARVDEFCRSILAEGRHADATEWIAVKTHTLGESSHARSRELVAKLVHAGAKAVYVCKIDSEEGDEENSGHLVVELPEETAIRKALFRELTKLAKRLGLFGDFDDGQRFAYVHLD